jgi:hypothetical protein
VFTPQSEELATAGDYVELAFQMGQLSHSIEFFQRVARDAGRGEVRTVADLERLVGKREAIQTTADLERLFRGGAQ